MRNEPAITERERTYIRRRLRYDRASLSLGVSETIRSVYWVLLHTETSWNVSGLVEMSGRSRASVHRVMVRAVQRKHVKERDGMYCLTRLGVWVVLRLHRETQQVALGQRRGFSQKIIKEFRDMGGKKVRAEAATISFKPEGKDKTRG